jgi:diguanylate cyclase (GGDEF)-like protein
MAAVAPDRLNLLLVAPAPAAGRIRGLFTGEAAAEYGVEHVLEDRPDPTRADDVDVLLYYQRDLSDLDRLAEWRHSRLYLPAILLTDTPVADADADEVDRLFDDRVCLAHLDAAGQLRRAARAAARAWQMHTQFREILAQSPDGVVVVSDVSRVLYANPAAISMFEKEERNFVGSAFRVPVPSGEIVEVSVGKSGTAEMRVVGVDWLGEQASLATLRDVTDRKRAEAALTHAADHDGLTGLRNRSRLQADINTAIDEARRRNLRLALFFIDLDNFKNINDDLGHDAGDEVLRIVAGRLTSVGRSGSMAGRLGGDEFIILVWDVAPGAEETIAERYLVELSKRIDLDGTEVRVNASIGIATYPGAADTAHGLISAADAAMYTAKREGKHRYRMYSKVAGDAIARRRRLESDILHALARDEMWLEYQPIVALKSNLKPMCLEALLRWRHPLYPDLKPEEFITLAENTGMIDAIGDWVMVQVCRQYGEWRSRPEFEGRLGGISVNVSALQLSNRSFAVSLRRLLRETQVPARELWIEVTETSLMHNLDECIAVLRELQALGVKVAIDDFGSGYSSLSCLRDLPVDIVKLDRSFLADIQENDHKQGIVKSVIDIARSLRLSVVAEGVEGEDQERFARTIECDLAQGFRFARPMPREAVEQFLSNEREHI